MTGSYRFLFDECLTQELVAVAASRGYASAHVRDIGRLGASDHSLAATAINEDLVFVTNNRADFLRIYRRLELHPGLIVLIPSVGGIRQETLFARVIDHISALPDIINMLVEIDADERIVLRDWPAQPE